MSDNFQQTVNLKEKMKELEARSERRVATPKPAAPKEGQIENVYGEQGVKTKSDFQKMERPKEPIFKTKEKSVKVVLYVIALILILAVVKWALTGKGGNTNTAPVDKWYSVKLVDGEMFFGQISNTASDPVVIKNVYYDYDQLQTKDGKTNTSTNETGNLRLVKRGKETHGPDGSLDVVRAQVIYMEPLKEDSKVLKAILDYEK